MESIQGLFLKGFFERYINYFCFTNVLEEKIYLSFYHCNRSYKIIQGIDSMATHHKKVLSLPLVQLNPLMLKSHS